MNLFLCIFVISCRAEIKFVCTQLHYKKFSYSAVLARDGNTCHIICFKRKNWLIYLFNPKLIFLQHDEFPIQQYIHSCNVFFHK